MPAQSVTTWYLEQRDPARLKPSRVPESAPRLERAEIPSPALNRYLYTHIGGDWHWHDRLPWTYERWMQWLDRPEVQTWVLYERGTPAGYFELEQQAAGDVEIAYFGIAPEFLGRGLGGHLLTVCLEKAWAMGGDPDTVPSRSEVGAGGGAGTRDRAASENHSVTTENEGRDTSSRVRRVWVHTCSLDHAAALKNYQSRGMVLYKTETHLKDVPEKATGLWPGAR